MEKNHPSLLSSLFPWISPFVIKFVIAKGGIEVQLFRNGRRITRWRASKLRRVLPESLVKWIDENQITTGPRPHPLTRQLWQYLSPLASQKLLVDVSELTALQEASQPANFALIWEIDQTSAHIQGKYRGADNYLGLSWFQKGNMIWPLLRPFSQEIATRFEQLVAQDPVIPLPETEALLNTTLPALQPHFSVCADFQLITDFAVNVIVQNAQSGRLTLTLESNYPQLLPTLSIPQEKTDFFLAQQALIQFPHRALTPVLMHLLQGKGTPVSLQGENIPLFIREQLPTMRHCYQMSDDMAQKITQAHPIVPITTLQASFASPIRTVEHGIGKYSVAATYQHQNYTLNMNELLDAHKCKQRFINQYGIWFEWSADSHHLVQNIRQRLVPRVLQPAEVMGLDTRQLDSSSQSKILPRLKWQWALLTVTSQHLFDPFDMQTLHLPEQYSLQFGERYLFNPERSYAKPPTSLRLTSSQSPLTARLPEARPVTAPSSVTRPPEVRPAPVVPPVQAKKEAAPQQTEPAMSAVSRFSTHEITITGKTTPLPSAALKFVLSPSLSFWEQARQWQDVSHECVPLKKFEHYAPTYLNMQKPGMLEYYFYWRSEVRNKRYPDTDIGYILVHIYEALAHIGFASPASALGRLIDLWAYYRDSFSILDKLLIPWIADFCAVNNVSYRVMDWYTRLLTIPVCVEDEQLIAEAWLRQGGDWAQMPSAVLYALIGWTHQTTLDQRNSPKHTLHEAYHLALSCIDHYLLEKNGIPGIIKRYGRDRSIEVKRTPFNGALIEYRYNFMTIERVNMAFNNIDFRQVVFSILEYADYIYQKEHLKIAKLFSSVSPVPIHINWQLAIKSTLTDKPPVQSSQSMGQAMPKAAPIPAVNQPLMRPKVSSPTSASQPERVTEDRPKPGRPSDPAEPPTPVQATPDNAGTRSVAPTRRPTIELNPVKIAQLHEASEHLQERLTVEETVPSLAAIQVSPLPPVQPVPAVKQEPEQPVVARRFEAVEAPVSQPVNKAGQMTPTQHIEQRVAAMKRYWQAFDEIHANQKPETESLWGLVEFAPSFNLDHRYQGDESHVFQNYQQLLPPDILIEINRLWGTAMLPRWPKRIVSEPFPHMLFAETFGPALKFWHDCALQAWFFCEGPYYYGKLTEFATYYQKDIYTLAKMDAPINEQLFEELTKYEPQLGQLHRFSRRMGNTVTTIHGNRRDGFKTIRDIISYYRLEWYEKYFEKYIQKICKSDINEIISYNKIISGSTDRAYTKEFAHIAEKATNHWFSGDISMLGEAILEKSSFQPQYCAILPPDRRAFAFAVFKILSDPQKYAENIKSTNPSLQISSDGRIPGKPYGQLNELAELSLRYVQLEEALGHTPTLNTFGSSRFTQCSNALHANKNKAWDIFSNAIQTTKKAFSLPDVTHESFTDNYIDTIKVDYAPQAWPLDQTNRRDKSRLEEDFARLRLDPAALPPLQRPERKNNAKPQKETEQKNSRQAAAALPITQQSVALTQTEVGLPLRKEVEQANSVRETAPVPHAPVQLDQEAISKLREESEHLQERLTIEEEGVRELPEVRAESVTKAAADVTPEIAEAAPVASVAGQVAQEVDEDWQVIYSQWRAEHWEILHLLCQGQTIQYTAEERKNRPPVSRLLDEINGPVDEQLNDLLIDAETQTLAPHLRAEVERLVRWYYSLEGR